MDHDQAVQSDASVELVHRGVDAFRIGDIVADNETVLRIKTDHEPVAAYR